MFFQNGLNSTVPCQRRHELLLNLYEFLMTMQNRNPLRRCRKLVTVGGRLSMCTASARGRQRLPSCAERSALEASDFMASPTSDMLRSARIRSSRP